MNIKIIRNAAIFLILIGVLGFASAADATSHAGQTQGYQLLAPLSDEFPKTVATGPGGFAGYAQSVITFIIGFSAVLAVLMITVGGFQYMLGESLHAKEAGRSRITSALLGLILLLASWLILNTINPDLLNLNLYIKPIKTFQDAPRGVNRSGLTQVDENTFRAPLERGGKCEPTIIYEGIALNHTGQASYPGEGTFCLYRRAQ